MGLLDRLTKTSPGPAPKTLAEMMAEQGIAGAGAAATAKPAAWKGSANLDSSMMSGRVPISPPQEQATAAGIYDNSKTEAWDKMLSGEAARWKLEEMEKTDRAKPRDVRSEAVANAQLAETAAQRDSAGTLPRVPTRGFAQRGLDR